jgi:hypothetical protein
MSDLRQILTERGESHGSLMGHARICQRMKDQMREVEGWNRLSADQRESLDMVMHKIARILNGNPDVVDHWIDIAGYSQLVADRLDRENHG